MISRFSSLSRVAAGLLGLAALTLAHDADACGGGMFYAPSEQETVSLAGHAVVVSISKDRTILWDRVAYAGSPAEFAWVMPVGAGAKLEIASAAFIDAMVDGTAKVLLSPEVACGDEEESYSGGCCGSTDAGGGGLGETGPVQREGVVVVNRASVGPYDTVTIKSDTPGAIGKWLTDNGFAIPAAMGPILDDYAAEGLEFIAAKLKPTASASDMKPLRVTMSGGLTTFPMRMLGAGAKDKVPISLTVISEGRYEAKGFSNVVIEGAKIRWDFDAGKSSFASARAALLAGNGGATWLTTSALSSGLLKQQGDETVGLREEDAYTTLADLYFARARELGEAKPSCFSQGLALEKPVPGVGEVVDLCPEPGKPCDKLGVAQIDSAWLTCEGADDLGKALVGMHVEDVWVTHLDAVLPVSALANDLTLVPAAKQTEVPRTLHVDAYDGDPCSVEGYAALREAPRHRRGAAPLGVLAFGIGLALMRKAGKRRRG